MGDIWSVVHAEREALVHDLETLPPHLWATPSLCPGWDVHDVLAHLVDDAKTTRLGFVRHLVAAGFDFDRSNALGITRERAGEPGHTLARFREVIGRSTSAPAPLVTRLVEVFVHGEDIRRPLGIGRDYPTVHVAAALLHQIKSSTKMGGGKERVQGLRLAATDTNLDIGTGRDVHGTALALLLAVSGRALGPEELTGPGAAMLMR